MSWPKVKECRYRSDVIGFLITWKDQRMTYHQAELSQHTYGGQSLIHASGTNIHWLPQVTLFDAT